MPPLIESRCFHASVALGANVYVICGKRGGKTLNSLERLDSLRIDSGTASWELIEISDADLKPRYWPIAVAISAKEITILGGIDSQSSYFCDVVIFDEASKRCTHKRQLVGQIGFCNVDQYEKAIGGEICFKVY